MNTHNYSLGKWISILYRYGQINMTHQFKKHNIGIGQHYMFLLPLFHNDGITQEQLSLKLNVDKATTARAVKKLEDEGYILRKIDETDKRAYHICLTNKSINIQPEIREILTDWRSLGENNIDKAVYELTKLTL
jgi:DNA-binding MarR family transcriptional regulator